MALPPWLNISPFEYLRAVEAGTQAGLSIREANERAFENAQRMEMERDRQTEALKQQAIENAQTRLAQERLEAYRQGELKNAQTRLANEQSNYGALAQYRQALASASEERNRQAEAKESAREKEAEGKQTAAEKREQAREDEANRRLDIMDTNEKRERQAHFFADPSGKQFMVLPGSTNAVPVNMPGASAANTSPGDSTIAPALLDTALGTAKDLGKLSLGLNPLFHQFAPLASIYDNSYTNSPSSIPTTPTATPKKRIRVKGPKGETGTIEQGDTLPDGWTEAQ